MASKVFKKTTELIQPAWSGGVIGIIDGIYVNDRFFEENIPIFGAVLTVSIKPTRHFRERSARPSIPTFKNGSVGLEQGFFRWWPLQDHEQEWTINFGDAFYGIGLNIISWDLDVDLPTDADIVYTVNYELEVKY